MEMDDEWWAMAKGVFEVVYLNFSTSSLVLFLDLEFICFWSICAGSIAAGEGAYELDRKSTRLNSSHVVTSRMPSSA